MARVTLFEPSRTRPWDAARARHLLERAGFGATPAEVRELVELGPRDAVAKLLDYPASPESPPALLDADPDIELADLRQADEQERREILRRLQRSQREAVSELKLWWLRRMVDTPRPLEEKLTLFWHNHFTTESSKVRSAAYLYEQNQLLRRGARGTLRELLRGISRDPAMLVYLDNFLNVRGRPNENYARELMELFTLGIGHYTEQDVQETARAFTGWSVDRPRPLARAAGREPRGFVFNARQHDDGPKTVLGQSGAFDGDDVIEILLRQDACAPFLVDKLWRAFVNDTPADADQPVRDSLAEILRAADYHFQPVLELLLRSAAFHADHNVGQRIKSPVELLVGSLRRLRLELPEQGWRLVYYSLMGMGQDLFDPPDVSGWAGGRDWINTSTLFLRYNLLGALVAGAEVNGRRLPPLPLDVQEVDEGSDEALVDSLAVQFLAVPLSAEQRQALIEHLAELPDEPGRFGRGRRADRPKLRAALHLLTSTPNYQVC